MAGRDLERSIEWEGLQTPFVVEHWATLPCPPFMSGAHKLTISRDESFDLRLVAEGVIADGGEEFRSRREAERELALGTFVEPHDVVLSGPFESQISLLAHVESVPNVSFGTRERPRFAQHGFVSRFRRQHTTRFDFRGGLDAIKPAPVGAVAWRSDWFINGPESFVGGRWTKRRRVATFTRDREIGGVSTLEAPSGGGSADHCLVDAGRVRFSFSRVPQCIAPDWCRAFSIDYAAPLPDDDTRDGVAELVSFVVGRRLMPIGSTTFDEEGWAVEEEAWNPWGQDVERICRRPDSAPLPSDPANVEDVLARLVPLYLELRQSLHLQDALLSYWLADEAFSGIDLTIYASALEALKQPWLKSKSRSLGQYMPEAEFKERLSVQLQALKERIDELQLPLAIMNKMNAAWRMGANEQLAAFLDELPVRIGPAEKRAIKARNAPTHGGLKAGADFRALTRHAHAYRVLFVRSFLKVLGYDGAYVDRVALGHPSRHSDEPAGGEGPAR